VLSLLLALSGAPLRSPDDACAAAAAALARADAADAQRARAAKAALGRGGAPGWSSDEEDAGGGGREGSPGDPLNERSPSPLSSSSSLSDWSDAEEAEVRARLDRAAVRHRQAQQQQAGGATALSSNTRPAGAAAAQAASRAASDALHAALRDAEPHCAPGGDTARAASLLVAQTGGAAHAACASLRTLLPRAVALEGGEVSERSMARDALRSLWGFPSAHFLTPSTAHHQNPNVASSQPHTPPRVAHLSPGALEALCSRIRAAAEECASLDWYCAAAVASEGRCGATVLAMACALEGQLVGARQGALGELESRVGLGGGCTLLELAHAAQRLRASAQHLSHLRDAASPAWLLRLCGCSPSYDLEAPPPAAHALAAEAARCLSALWAAVCDGAADGNAQGTAQRGALAAFACAVQPLCASLHALLLDGHLGSLAPQAAAEAPIQAGPGMASLDGASDVSRFWEDGLLARPQPCTPAFLQPLLPHLLLAARSRRLLRHARARARAGACEEEEEAGGGGGGGRGAPAGPAEGEEAPEEAEEEEELEQDLHAHFCAALQRMLRSTSGDDAEAELPHAAAAADDDDASRARVAAAQARVLAPSALPPVLAPRWAAGGGGDPGSSQAPRLAVAVEPEAPHEDMPCMCASTWLPPRRHGATSSLPPLCAWLTASAAWEVAPPPAHLLLERSLLSELRRRAACASMAALAALRGQWRLGEELEALQALFLCSAGGFATQVTDALRLSAHARTPAHPQSWHATSGALEDAMAAWAQVEPALARMRGRIFVVPAPSSATPLGGAAVTSGGADLVASVPEPLRGARVLCRVRWPLGVIVSASDVERYSRTFAQLLALRCAVGASEACAGRARKRRVPPAALRTALEAEVRHALRALHEHVLGRVLEPAAAQLRSQLASARDIDAARRAHSAFLAEVLRGSWAQPDALWTLCAPAVRAIMAVAARLEGFQECEKQEQEAELQALGDAFSQALRELLRLLGAKLRSGGTAQQVGECEALLARLQGNEYWQSPLV